MESDTFSRALPFNYDFVLRSTAFAMSVDIQSEFYSISKGKRARK
jgi:hypothetical protein